MSEQIRETWLQKIRDIASLIEKAEYESRKSDADVKRVLAVLKTKALGEGIKTTSAQDTWAENQSELYEARLLHAKNKALLTGLRVRLKALEVGFEEWRTQMVSKRKEMERYGVESG